MKITIVLPISRDTYLQRLFPSLEFMICPSNTSILGIVDGDMKLYEQARNYITTSKFKERLCIHRHGQPQTTITSRRRRIAEIHNEAKQYLKTAELLFLIEDDTLYHPSTLRRMFEVYKDYPHAGFVSGVQIGRWGLRYIGLWEVDNVYDPTKISSSQLKSGVSEIDGSGFYCMLTRKETYMKHTFEPYDNILGPDFNYGLWLRREGYRNYANFDVHCTHLTQKEELKVAQVAQVKYEKGDDKKWKSEL